MDTAFPYPDGEYALGVIRSTSVTVFHTPVLMLPSTSDSNVLRQMLNLTKLNTPELSKEQGDGDTLHDDGFIPQPTSPDVSICSPAPMHVFNNPREDVSLGVRTPSPAVFLCPDGLVNQSMASMTPSPVQLHYTSSRVGYVYSSPFSGLGPAGELNPRQHEPVFSPQNKSTLTISTTTTPETIAAHVVNGSLKSTSGSPSLSAATTPTPINGAAAINSGNKSNVISHNNAKLLARKRLVGNDWVHIIFADSPPPVPNEVSIGSKPTAPTMLGNHEIPQSPSSFTEYTDSLNVFTSTFCQVVIIVYKIATQHPLITEMNVMESSTTDNGSTGSSQSIINCSGSNSNNKQTKYSVLVCIRPTAPSCIHYLGGYYVSRLL